MAASNEDAAAEAVRTWVKKLLDEVVREMLRIKAIPGSRVQASPAWMVPHEILIARVWSIGKESEFIWTIGIDKFIADYIAGSMASTPRDAARHFALKWQLDADRILQQEPGRSPSKRDRKKLQDYSAELVRRAEFLYDLCDQDSAWEQLNPTVN